MDGGPSSEVLLLSRAAAPGIAARAASSRPASSAARAALGGSDLGRPEIGGHDGEVVEHAAEGLLHEVRCQLPGQRRHHPRKHLADARGREVGAVEDAAGSSNSSPSVADTVIGRACHPAEDPSQAHSMSCPCPHPARCPDTDGQLGQLWRLVVVVAVGVQLDYAGRSPARDECVAEAVDDLDPQRARRHRGILGEAPLRS